jgi:hypothetical protein
MCRNLVNLLGEVTGVVTQRYLFEKLAILSATHEKQQSGEIKIPLRIQNEKFEKVPLTFAT